MNKLPKLTANHKELLSKTTKYFDENLRESPWRADYVIIRMAQEASNEYSDIIFVPNFSDKDDFNFYTPYKCNAFRSNTTKLISGAYQYRLASRFKCVYGQQMQPVFYENTYTEEVLSDSTDKYLMGINLLIHPIHSIFPNYTPISNISHGSIMIDSKAHPQIKQNFLNNHSSFKLFIVDFHFLL